MRQGKLTKLAKTTDLVSNTPLRTDTIEGCFESLPEEGRVFRIIGAAITPGADGRMITTSTVQKVNKNGFTILFDTHNSKYKLELLDEN